MEKLKRRWGLRNNLQLGIVFLVFAITGSSTAYFAKPILAFLSWEREAFEEAFFFGGLAYLVLYFLVMLPIYQVLLVSIGSVFGQFRFFWNFEKKMLRSLSFGLVFNTK